MQPGGLSLSAMPTRAMPICVLIALLALVGGGGGHTARAADARRPNILHINADDHRADGLHALGNELLQTPNLDALAARGLVFSHCYTQGSMVGAVCQPSRTMLLTGKSWL